MKKIKELKQNLIVDKYNAIEWGILAIVLLCFFLTLFYGDNIGMFLIYFWKNDQFLRLNTISALGDNQLTYGLVQQLFCELWALPINIAYLIRPFMVANTFTVLWYKLAMVFVFCLVLRETDKICRFLDMEERYIKWMRILMISTITVALPVFHIAQTDVLYLYFLLLAIRFYYEEKQWKMLIAFALAVSCKYLAVFAFIPFILLIEKRIVRIVRDCAVGISLVPIQMIWYKLIALADYKILGRTRSLIEQEVFVVNEAGNTVKDTVMATTDEAYSGFMSHYLYKALFFEVPAIHKNNAASVLVVLFVLLCIWCYVQKKNDKEQWNRICFYAMTMGWMIFFCMASPNPYWIVVMYPFMFILIFLDRERLRTNIILTNVFSLSLFVTYIVNYAHVYGGSSNLDHLLLRGLKKGEYDMEYGPQVYGYLSRLGIDEFMSIIVAICLASAIGLVVVTYPKVRISEELTQKEEDTLLHGVTIWQIAVLAVWYVVCVWAVSSW